MYNQPPVVPYHGSDLTLNQWLFERWQRFHSANPPAKVFYLTTEQVLELAGSHPVLAPVTYVGTELRFMGYPTVRIRDWHHISELNLP